MVIYIMTLVIGPLPAARNSHAHHLILPFTNSTQFPVEFRHAAQRPLCNHEDLHADRFVLPSP